MAEEGGSADELPFEVCCGWKIGVADSLRQEPEVFKRLFAMQAQLEASEQALREKLTRARDTKRTRDADFELLQAANARYSPCQHLGAAIIPRTGQRCFRMLIKRKLPAAISKSQLCWKISRPNAKLRYCRQCASGPFLRALSAESYGAGAERVGREARRA